MRSIILYGGGGQKVRAQMLQLFNDIKLSSHEQCFFGKIGLL